MPQLTANDLKTKGIAAIETVLASSPEAMISVRGSERFVVMGVERYHYLRECELEAALAQSQADLAAGRFVVESAAEHVNRIDKLQSRAPAKRAEKKTASKPAPKPVSRSSRSA